MVIKQDQKVYCIASVILGVQPQLRREDWYHQFTKKAKINTDIQLGEELKTIMATVY